MLTIRIGTRPSPLALAQVKIVADRIKLSYPNSRIITVPIKTSGDKSTAFFSNDPSGLKGMFTREIEQALINGEIDLAVHSLKDLSADINPKLPVLAYTERGNPFDALVMNNRGGNIIGTSSLRRRLQIERLMPDVKVVPVRGNIGTRLRKLDDGEISGLILSAAGLERLGLSGRITRVFTADEVIPAPGQGILACQGRFEGDYSYLTAVNDDSSRYCAIAERSFSRRIGSGCNVPVGAYAVVEGDVLTLRGLFVDGEGRFKKGMISGKREEAELIGKNLAEVITL